MQSFGSNIYEKLLLTPLVRVRAWKAWRLHRASQLESQRALEAASGRLARRRVSAAFKAWLLLLAERKEAANHAEVMAR